MMRARAVCAVFLLTAVQCAGVLAQTPGAVEIVRTTSNQVIEKLNQERENLENQPELLYGLIQEMVVPHFDFPIMSRWVLGKVWNTADEATRQEFIEQFRTLLVRTYAKALMEYSDEKIVYLPVESNPNSNLVMVKTQVKGAGNSKPVPINYRMHVSGGEWKVIDISVDGVSLIGTYRGSFASEIRKNGIESLIQKLTDRNRRLIESGEN